MSIGFGFGADAVDAFSLQGTINSSDAIISDINWDGFSWPWGCCWPWPTDGSVPESAAATEEAFFPGERPSPHLALLNLSPTTSASPGPGTSMGHPREWSTMNSVKIAKISLDFHNMRCTSTQQALFIFWHQGCHLDLRVLQMDFRILQMDLRVLQMDFRVLQMVLRYLPLIEGQINKTPLPLYPCMYSCEKSRIQ